MSDWTYVAGEGGFNQDFRIIDQETGEVLDLSGASLTMFIQSTNLTDSFPTGGTGMTVVTNQNNEQVGRLVVQSNFMPQTADIYLAQIEIVSASTFKTFIINLRVIRNLGA